jgi:hypothetical protein
VLFSKLPILLPPKVRNHLEKSTRLRIFGARLQVAAAK